MTNFSQIMRDWRRMCNKMDEGYEVEACLHCPLTLADVTKSGCDAIYTDWAADVDWDKIASVVEAWAKENPEPIYPTWEMYLAERMTADMQDGKTHNPQSVEEYMRQTSIPADIAEKLGLEPKGGNSGV